MFMTKRGVGSTARLYLCLDAVPAAAAGLEQMHQALASTAEPSLCPPAYRLLNSHQVQMQARLVTKHEA